MYLFVSGIENFGSVASIFSLSKSSFIICHSLSSVSNDELCACSCKDGFYMCTRMYAK
jgi:hypothetical protein